MRSAAGMLFTAGGGSGRSGRTTGTGRHDQGWTGAAGSGATRPFASPQLNTQQHIGRLQLFDPAAGQQQSNAHTDGGADPASRKKAYTETKPGMHIEESHTLPPFVLDTRFPALGSLANDSFRDDPRKTAGLASTVGV